jgi:hypothetical protein
MTEQKLSCPKCKKTWIAEILWGYPADMDVIEEELEKKEMVLGGCLITDNDPQWECNSCHHKWGDAEHNEPDKTDSFDYDQGFNVEEVYDQ